VDVAGELRAMTRYVEATDGIERILDRVGRRLAGVAVLVAPSGTTVPADRPVPAALAGDLRSVRTGRAGAIAADLDGRPVCLVALTGPAPRPALVVRRDTGRDFSPDERALLADASVPLGLAWRERQLRARAARLDRVEARNREVVLHQLQAGHIADARHAAAVLGPDLPDRVRIHIVESADPRVTETLSWCRETAQRWAWVVRCPVHRRHVVVIAHADADALTNSLRARAVEEAAFHLGSSEELALRDCVTGYTHAFHALSVARHRPERHATFRGHGELSALLAELGSGWAARTLAPLLSYRSARPQDPDAGELVHTLASWLTFHGLAARQLKVHRNTLAARLRLIGSLLDAELAEVATQARLQLALQVVGTPAGSGAPLEQLLTRPEVRDWAAQQRAPLRGADPRLVDTLRAWLDNRAQIGATATALGVSPSGVRKRLGRVEQLVQRSLLDSPSARYDLCLAFGLTDR
jgi:sugar diacid utilization regulator